MVSEYNKPKRHFFHADVDIADSVCAVVFSIRESHSFLTSCVVGGNVALVV